MVHDEEPGSFSNLSYSPSRCLEVEAHHLMPGLQRIAAQSALVIERAEGSLVYGQSGALIDLYAGAGVCAVGHSHPRFVDAVTDQVARHIVGSFTSAARARYVELLATVTPPGLDLVQLYSGGAEAVEAALRLARSHTSRSSFLSFWGAFHGKTRGAISLAGTELRSRYNPAGSSFHLTPYGDSRSCVFGRCADCEVGCVAHARRVIEINAPHDLAAIVVEPAQGTSGNVFPEPDFLPQLRSLADEFGALLIFDEMITGFGRTGRMFRCEEVGVTPDILVIGKGMGNGVPVSGVVTTSKIGSALPFAGASGSSSSYGGNPLSSAAALATLEILIEEELVANAASVGRLLKRGLEERLARNCLVERVRGEGLLLAIDLVESMVDGRNASVQQELFHRTIESGVLVAAYTSPIRINPPLCISSELSELAVDRIGEAFDDVVADLQVLPK